MTVEVTSVKIFQSQMTDTVSEKFSEFQLISCAGKKKEFK